MWVKYVQWCRKYFRTSHQEAKGVSFLLILLAFLIIGTLLVRNIHWGETPILSYSDEQIDSIFYLKENNTRSTHYFSFDPNTEQNLDSLGIPNYLALRIKKYRNAGGSFKIKSDLLKIYNFPDSLFQSLVPYILLPDKLAPKHYIKKETRSPTFKKRPIAIPPVQIDITEADTSILKDIKGIGSVLALRIINFRDKLGGIYSKEQLRDVYGLKEEVANQLISQITISTVNVKQINLNTASFKKMVRHPYLNYDDVKNIFNFKNKYGGFNMVEDLNTNHIISDSLYAKLKPYLKI